LGIHRTAAWLFPQWSSCAEDLQLDSFYDNQYLLSKLIYRTFSHDFKLASYQPNINDYKPDNTSTADPYKEHKQGIDADLLDQVAQAFMIKDPLDNTIRIRTYGEFYSIWKRSDQEFDFKRLEYLLKYLHPKNKRVLWRILIAQAHIYQLLIENYLSNDSTDISEKIPLMNSDEEQMKLFDLRNEEDKKKISDDDVMEPLTAVKEYLENDVAVDYKKYRGRHKGIKSSNNAIE
jgi:hypothetical protein